MKYHSLTIRPNNIYVQESIEFDTIIKSVSLTPAVEEDSKRSSLIAKIDNQKITLCNLLTNTTESKILNIPLKSGTKVELHTEGVNEIDLLFLEIEPEELEKKETRTEYKVIRVAENKTHTVNQEDRIKILNISLDNDITRLGNTSQIGNNQGKTEITIREGETVLLRIELEEGVRESEVVDIEIEGKTVEIEVKGEGTVELLVLVEKEEKEKEEIGESKWTEIEEVEEEIKEGEKEETTEVTEIVEIEEIEESHPLTNTTGKREETTGTASISPAVASPTINTKRKTEEETSKKVKTEKKEKTEKISESPKKEKDEKISKKSEDKKPEDDEWKREEIKEETEVKVLSEGIGRLIGRRSVVSADYTVESNGEIENFQEKIMVRKMSSHPYLKYFAEKVKGAREGSVFSGTVRRTENKQKEITTTTEIVVKVGKIE